jgi:hypothetical protein
MKSLDHDNRIASMQRRKKILDLEIECLKLRRDDQRLREQPQPVLPVVKES